MTSTGPSETSTTKPLLTGTLLDRARAARVMENFGLDGIVVGNPINIYQATGYIAPMATVQSYIGGLAIAVVPHDERLPIALVIRSYAYYSQFADIHRDIDCEIYQVNDPADASSILATGVEPVAGTAWILPNRQKAPLDGIERHRAEATRKSAEVHPVSISLKMALGKALKDLGLDRSRVGLDAAVARETLADAAPGATLSDATTVMAAIRLVKSSVEVELMRRAARANSEAALAAVRSMQKGCTYNELRTSFYAEACKRGNIPMWMIIDSVHPESFDAAFYDGQAFLIDAVSRGSGYHGDYGRTVFVGEPSKSMRRATQAIATAWDAVREKLQPGLRYSELRAIGVDTLRKAGFDTAVRFTAHSVGLYHTDAVGLGDVLLEEGMIISFDCPVMETGIGGSAHLEDLTLITASGHQTLNDTGNQVITI